METRLASAACRPQLPSRVRFAIGSGAGAADSELHLRRGSSEYDKVRRSSGRVEPGRVEPSCVAESLNKPCSLA